MEMECMMLYPKIYNLKKSNALINALIILSIFIVGICKTINVLTYKEFNWSFIVTISIIYIWCTVIYAIRKHTNVAGYVVVHLFLSTFFVFFLDKSMGFHGWSITLAFPIIFITANVIMFVLTLISRKRYIKYAFFHLIIFATSFIIPMLYYFTQIESFVFTIFMIISNFISVITFLTTLCLCGKSLLDAAERTLHM